MNKRLLHNYLFIIGFFYYLIVPLLVGVYGWWRDFPGMEQWHAYFYKNLIIPYLLLIFTCLSFFYLGSFLPLMFKRNKLVLKENTSIVSINSFVFFSWPLIFLVQILIIKNIDILFSGYTMEYNKHFLGTLGTFNVLFTFFYIFILTSGKKTKTQKILLLVICEISIILLGIGSRMYVLFPLLAYIFYKYQSGHIKIRKLLFFGLILFFLFLFIGVWRVGYDLDFSFFIFIFFAEPIFTWYSVSTMFFYNSSLPILAYPLNYLTSFVNFIPSAFFPDKGDYIIGANDLLYYSSPLGADNIITSLVANFGVFFTPFIFFILGFFYTVISYQGKSDFWKTYYYLICAILPFQFFRDNLAILNKMYLYNLLFIPILLILVYKFLLKR